MTLLETAIYLADKLEVAAIIATPDENLSLEEKGILRIRFANNGAAKLLGYKCSEDMEGNDVKSIMPRSDAEVHDKQIIDYAHRTNVNSSKSRRSSSSTVVGSWRALESKRADGAKVPIYLNVADLKEGTERVFVALLLDRTPEVEQQKELLDQISKTNSIIKELTHAKEVAVKSRKEVEKNLFKMKELNSQMSILKLMFGGTLVLVMLMAGLIATSWLTGIGWDSSRDALGILERVLLVVVGILGTSAASLFDRAKKADND